MRRLIVIALMLLAAVTASAKKDWKGKVVDQSGEPVAYANVAVLSKADSTVVCGAVTEEDGSFYIATQETDGIMMVAMLGYKTVYLTPVDGMVITLKDDSAMLEAAAVRAVMPKTQLTGEGLQTNVRGSVLEHVGSARDVLAKTPGLIKGQNGLEVIGKGAPLVYINGRKVSDASELDRLQSADIQSVEVITNPGAQYDATVRAVVRIKTIRRQGDGFGFNLNASDAQSLRWARGNDASGAVNVNYRTGGLDFFGGLNYDSNSLRQLSDANTASYSVRDHAVSVFENRGTIDGQFFGSAIHGHAGVNWQLADNHFLGGKVEWGRYLKNHSTTWIVTDVYEDNRLMDKLSTVSEDTMGPSPKGNLGANLYYNGVIGGKLGVDMNFDYYGTDESVSSTSVETSSMSQDARLGSTSRGSARMYAAKAVLSYPVWMGQLQAGTEDSFTRRADEYQISGISIPASRAQVKEDNYAAFATYGLYIPQVGQFSLGARYEYVKYAYEDALNPDNDLSRSYGNLFPTFSYANAFGPVQVLLNYSAKTRRPSYELLSGAIRYNSRYIWQSGNAKLQPQIMHNVSLMTLWKFFTVAVNYTRTNDAMMTWSSPYHAEGVYDGVVLVRPVNIDSPYRTMAAYVNGTPTIGPWMLNCTVGVQSQWLSLNLEDPREPSGIRVKSFNDKPVFFAQLFNTFTLGGGWQLELGGSFTSTGYTQNVLLAKPVLDLTAAVQKTLLKDGSLVLRLEGADLAGLTRFDVDTDFGSHTIIQTNLMDTQRVKLSVRYNFNVAQSKYKGTGAGADNKARM